MGRAARYVCNSCSRAFTLEFFEQSNADFRGACLFCEVKQTVSADAGNSRSDALTLKVEALNQENCELRAEIDQLRKIIQGSGLYQHGSPLSSRRNNPASLPTTPPPPTPSPGYHNVQYPRPPITPSPYRIMDKNGHKNKKSLPPTKPITVTNNRFHHLQDEMDETDDYSYSDEDPHIIIGDSLARNMSGLMNQTRHSKTTAYVYPGANITEIEGKVRDMRQTGKKTCLVVSVGSNDIYHKSVASQVVIEKYRELIGTMKDRFSNIILIGALPRHFESNFSLSRAIGINNIVQQLCKEAKIGFIDAWVDFIGDKRMYYRDGIHLNHKGSKHLVSLISRQMTKQLHKVNFY